MNTNAHLLRFIKLWCPVHRYFLFAWLLFFVLFIYRVDPVKFDKVRANKNPFQFFWSPRNFPVEWRNPRVRFRNWNRKFTPFVFIARVWGDVEGARGRGFRVFFTQWKPINTERDTVEFLGKSVRARASVSVYVVQIQVALMSPSPARLIVWYHFRNRRATVSGSATS